MLKTISQYEVAIENRIYRLVCDFDSPLDHVKEFLFQAQKFVGNVQDQIKAMEAQQHQQSNPAVPSSQPQVVSQNDSSAQPVENQSKIEQIHSEGQTNG